MKSKLLLFVAILMCCSLLFPAIMPSVMASAELRSEKITTQLYWEMYNYENDDTLLRIRIELNAPSPQEVDAMVPVPDRLTMNEYIAYKDALKKNREEVYSTINSAFVEHYFNETEELVEQYKEMAYVLATVSKSKIPMLAALDEVTQVDLVITGEAPPAHPPVFPPFEPGPDDPVYSDKIELRLQRQMYGTADDVLIPILVMLKAPSLAEIDATVPVPKDLTSAEQVETYISAVYKTRAKTYGDIAANFVYDHILRGRDRVYYACDDHPYVLAAMTKSRITALAELDEILYIDQYDIPVYAGDDVDLPDLPCEHDYKATVTTLTCTESGYITYTCSKCGDEYVADEIAALGHDWDEGVVTKEATETEQGERTFTCTRCGETRAESIPVKEHVHAYTAAVTAPTCTELGYTIHTCACGDSYVDTAVPALGHDWDAGVITKEATETEQGERTFTCARCGEKKTEAIPVKEHVHHYIEIKTAPTCTEVGYSVFTCACGRSYKGDEVPALGHDFKDGVCTRCEAKDPDYEEPVIEPFRFDDVKDDKSFYFEPVYWAVDQKITKGTSEKLFSPDDGCTRAQVVTFLWRAAGEPEPTKSENPFKDVRETDYFYKAVLWAVEKGITKGTSADKFSPDATCTRAQIVTFLYRAEGTPEVVKKSKPFHDVADGEYFADAVAWAVENGVTTGKSADTFAPNATCTRGEIVTFLYRSSKE